MPTGPTMVLRSVNLPAFMDGELRTFAFVLRRSKSDLIRMFVHRGLSRMRDQLQKDPSDQTIQRLAQEVAQSVDYSEMEKEAARSSHKNIVEVMDRMMPKAR